MFKQKTKPISLSGNKCYKVEVFESDQEDRGGKTWNESVQLCREGPGLNPDLASISNADEQSKLSYSKKIKRTTIAKIVYKQGFELKCGAGK